MYGFSRIFCLSKDGFGSERSIFKKVDDIAVKLKPEILSSSKRAYAFANYYLSQQGENDGHTWVYVDDLRGEAQSMIHESITQFDEMLAHESKGGVFLHIEGDRVGLNRYYEVEESIYDILTHLNNTPFVGKVTEDQISAGISQTEDEQGFEFTDEQKDVIYQSFNQNVTLISGKAGCVDADTEFFDGNGWKRIADYQVGDKVLQWNKDGSAELVSPLAYIKAPCDYLWEFKTQYGIDQCLSEEHNCCWMSYKNKFNECSFEELKRKQETRGFYGRFITSFRYDGKGIDYNDAVIRLFVAAIADGTFNYQADLDWLSYKRVRFHLKKDRKKERIVKLLNCAGLPWWHKESAAEGYTDFYCDLPERLKEFPASWYNCSNHQLEVLADELMYWDGYAGHGNRLGNISTTSKINADFIQFVFSATGKRASIYSDDRRGQISQSNGKKYTRKNVGYSVNITDRTLVGLSTPSMNDKPTQFYRYKTIDGFKYCFTVPSHYLVLRRNNRIFVTGNSGKTSIARAILNIYRKASCSIAACSLSAKAAVRITEATGFRASTIHMLLGTIGKSGMFKHDAENPLDENVIFLDESSMVNASLLRSLLKAIPSGARIIMCGDHLQLPPIGYGNPFSDLLQMKSTFKSFELKTVHRQAAKSGILTDANKIRAGEFPVAEPAVRVVSGENKDMLYAFRDDRENMQELSVRRFLSSAEKNGIDNVVMVVPRRMNCLNSTDELNAMIQARLFGKSVPSIRRGYDVFKLGARIIQVENNYDKNVMNGEMG